MTRSGKSSVAGGPAVAGATPRRRSGAPGRLALFLLAWPTLFLVLAINGMLPSWPTPLGEPVTLVDVGARTFQVPDRLMVPDSGVTRNGTPGVAIAYAPPLHLPMIGLRVTPLAAGEEGLPWMRAACAEAGGDGQSRCIGYVRLSGDTVASASIPAAMAPQWERVAPDVSWFVESMAWKPDPVEWVYRRGAAMLGWTLVLAAVAAGGIAMYAVRRRRLRIAARG